jgi:N-methylhydantoinase A
MGGTSCDVSVADHGEVKLAEAREIAGRPLQMATVDVHTVGAGGGSIAWRDAGGALRVGPRSAGAEPGPACYGRGGTEPTVTDANLLLGYLPAGETLAGGIELDRTAAEKAIGGLAGSLGLDPVETAEGIVRVANQEMAAALRVVSVERGIDPRERALVAFGGAGPLHAAAMADDLEMPRIVVPRAGGVLSALGLVSAGRRRDRARTVLIGGDALTQERVESEIAQVQAEALKGLATESAEARAELGLRYRGQSFELRVTAPSPCSPEFLREAFEQEHERRYGYRDPELAIELVTIAVAAVAAAPELGLEARGHGANELVQSERVATFGGEALPARVLRGEPDAGTRAEGPCIFELPETTLVLPPGWSAVVDADGTIICERRAV